MGGSSCGKGGRKGVRRRSQKIINLVLAINLRLREDDEYAKQGRSSIWVFLPIRLLWRAYEEAYSVGAAGFFVEIDLILV